MKRYEANNQQTQAQEGDKGQLRQSFLPDALIAKKSEEPKTAGY